MKVRDTVDPDRPGNRLGGDFVVAARDAVQHPRQQQVVHRALPMQRLIRPQRHLAPRDMANPGHANRHALARQADRLGVAAMTAPAHRRILAGVALARQRGHLRVEQLLDMHQAQRDQGPDELHLGVHLQLGVVLATDDLDRAQRATLLALLTGRRTLLILAPLSRGVMVVFVNVIKPQGLEPLQFPTKFRSPSIAGSSRMYLGIVSRGELT